MTLSQERVTECFGTFYPHWVDFDDDYDPHTVLDELFSENGLEGMREDLWCMFKTAILNGSAYGDHVMRSNLVFFFERMNDLFSAAYLIDKEKQDQTKKSVEPELITQT